MAINRGAFRTISTDKTPYKHVTKRTTSLSGKPLVRFEATKVINGRKVVIHRETAEAAARELDIQLIKGGHEPINILKKKQ